MDSPSNQQYSPAPHSAVADWIVGLTCAALGGAGGHFAFGWLLNQGFYGLILPGALLGICGGLFVKRRNIGLGVVLGIAAVALSIYSEWKFLPFAKDESFEYFISNLMLLKMWTKIMIIGGGICGFWFGMGRNL